VMAEEIGIQCLRVIEFKFRPSFCNFQEKQGSKFAVRSEEDKMLPMDLSPRGNDGVEDCADPLNRIRYSLSDIG
jgi:hypothetical protein